MKFRKSLAILIASTFLGTTAFVLIQPASAVPNAVATTEAELAVTGRVFPDPQGCLAYGVPDDDTDGIKNTPPGVSPYAKGRVCAEYFLGYDEVIAGSNFLQQKFPRFMRVIRLDQAYDDPNYKSAGVPTTFGPNEDGQPEVLSRDRQPLYLFKVTDAQSPIPEKDRLHFAYALSIHGIERAGLEGGIRAMEDLISWAACTYDESAAPACADEGPFQPNGKKIVETPTTNEVPTADEVLRRSVIYFVPPNPDGWRRGDPSAGGAYFQRYNGNGVDLNRDWPTVGYTYRPYTPGSEPETKAYRDVLTKLRDQTSGKRFAGGIDLHGQLTAVAFSYTLLGAGQRDYRRNFSTVDQSLRAWEDQTKRLSWSPHIGDTNNDGQIDSGDCGRTVPAFGGNFPYCVADQWGTVTDTIGYQITGGFGDWFESPIGLRAVGIDNEMSLSHIVPANVFDPVNEQMHVDGNKGLIYSQLSSMLTEKEFVYDPPGNIGYVFNPDRLKVEASADTQDPGFPAQNDINTIVPCAADCQGGTFVMADGNQPTLEFDVVGPDVGVFNGGITVQATFTNVQGIGAGSVPRLYLERFDEEGGGHWQTAATSFVQGGDEQSPAPDLYLQSGQVVSVNDPVAGKWRVRIDDLSGSPVRLKVDFHPVSADDDPGQTAIDASSMDFFKELNEYVPDGQELTPVNVDDILANPFVLDQFDSLVVVDDFMPGFVPEEEPPFTGEPQNKIDFSIPVATDEDTFEFNVQGPPEADNDLMVVTANWPVPSDWDIYLERQLSNGDWEPRGCHCSFVAVGERLVVTEPEAGKWRIRVDNFIAAPQPVEGTVEFSSDPTPPESGDSRYTPAQFDQYASALAGFAGDGGNLVLTDGALDGLESFGVVAPGSVRSSQPSGRGAVPRYQMDVPERGNLCTPNSPDPLLLDVCLPGTAGGTARQAVEPAPLGYAPDATLDPAKGAKLTQFFVNRAAWETGCGKATAAECTSAVFGEDVGLGERHVGAGRIRIAGAMLPDPNYAPGGPRDMRFGLASYALTFSAWQMFLNLVNYERPPAIVDLAAAITDSPDPVVAGEVLTYNITATNASGFSAPGVQVKDELPSGTSLVSASASQGSCSGSSTVTCSVGRLPAGGSATVTIQVRPSQAGTLSNTASVSGDREDSNAQNNSASTTTTVEPAPAPDLKPASLNASRSTIRKGQKVRLTAAIQNIGTKDAQNVRVQFKEGSRQIGSVKTIAGISAGGADTASVTWKPRTRGNRTITVVVDPANSIGELNEDNNSLSKVFRVR